jgi:hypothetical protein
VEWIVSFAIAAALIYIARRSLRNRSGVARSDNSATIVHPYRSGASKDDIVSIVDPSNDPSEISLSFKNVFAMLTVERRDALICFYMERHKCGAVEAMKIAIADRETDEERFR